MLIFSSLLKIAEDDDDLWQFDTIRRKSLMNVQNDDDDMDLPSSVDPPSIAPTVRPAPTRLPTSLRGLFDDDTAPNGTLKPSLPPSTTIPVFTPPVVSSPAREVASTKKVGLPEGVDDVQLAKYNAFSFPSHQPRRSQDTTPSVPAPRLPPTNYSPVARARSTNMADTDTSSVENPPSVPLGRKPSLIRQASVAVMESTPALPLLPPVRPFAARDRSGSASSKGSDGANSTKSLVLPGLKDAIKVVLIFILFLPDYSSILPGAFSHIRASNGNVRFTPSITIDHHYQLSVQHPFARSIGSASPRYPRRCECIDNVTSQHEKQFTATH